MSDGGGPDSTAARVALWRALHVEQDAPPHVIEDAIGLELLEPEEGWRERPDMHPQGTAPFRASIVARARFIEDRLTGAAGGTGQYVILGAGLDSFAQRRPDIASAMTLFEVDRPGPQAWKRRRLVERGYGVPDWLRLVPVDFEKEEDWWQALLVHGFDPARPALFASTGVSMYLSREAILATLRQLARAAAGSTLVLSFLLPIELADPDARPGLERAVRGAAASGTPFISFFTPGEIMALAREAGFRGISHVSADALAALYFQDRPDGLRPPRNAEELLVAST
ncbi:MAG: class I SAM-dependent methyltransferase [Sphingobium sp.]